VSSLIVATIAGLLKILLLLASLLVLLRGHNEPGGGFVGGLLAAAAFALGTLIHAGDRARLKRGLPPHLLLGAGLLTAAGSGLPAVLRGRPFLSSLKLSIPLPFDLELSLGTVLAFDIGVYLVVIGAALMIVFSLEEESG